MIQCNRMLKYKIINSLVETSSLNNIKAMNREINENGASSENLFVYRQDSSSKSTHFLSTRSQGMHNLTIYIFLIDDYDCRFSIKQSTVEIACCINCFLVIHWNIIIASNNILHKNLPYTDFPAWYIVLRNFGNLNFILMKKGVNCNVFDSYSEIPGFNIAGDNGFPE
jgi:hypothetical protein